MTPRTAPPSHVRVRPMTPGIPRAARLRAYLVGCVVTVGLCAVAWRAWALQINEGDHYRAIADKQHALSVAIPAPRGNIVDEHGRPLAVSADADSVWANPHDIRDVTDTADKLAKLLGGDPASLEAKLGGDHRFAWLARHIDPDLARKVTGAKLPGIEVSKEPRRWYPAHAVGGTVIGKSDIDGNGVDGIELALNAELVGHRGTGVALRDARGKRMFADGIEQPEPGAEVRLSLDLTIQSIAEAAIADAVRSHKARSGVVVVLEVGTGRVLAMASAPSIDPNAPNAIGGAKPADSDAKPDGKAEPAARPEWPRNRAVADAYEAGSVMKMFSVAAALDDGVVTPDTWFDLDGGHLTISGRSTGVSDVDHDDSLTVAGIIKRSSNVGAAKIALRFGGVKLYAALKRFGFGARTGIELPGEQVGMLRDGARWRDIELATISYGYGLTVTPLQLVAALAAFADGGMYHAPHIVDRVVEPDGTIAYQPQASVRRVLSERAAGQMLGMLASVFEGGPQAGTAASIVVPGFRCAGKTGTARRFNTATKQYDVDRHLSTFAGLAPLDHPRLAIVAMVDDPSGGDYMGGKVAGPVFAVIAGDALRYLGVPGGPAICPALQPGASPPLVKTCLPAPKSGASAANAHPAASSP